MEHGEHMIIREAREDDVAPLTELVHAAYAQHAEQGLNFTAVDQTEATTRYRTFSGMSWVVDVDGTVVATATVSVPPGEVIRQLSTVARENGMAWLNQLAVHPAHRGVGLARTLFERACEHGVAVGARTIGLDTAAPAQGLRELYARWGFADRETIHWPGKTYESVVMVRSLEAEPLSAV